MKKYLAILFLFFSFQSFGQYIQTDWKTYVSNVVLLTDSTYTFDAEPIDYNDPGATSRTIGNYFIDFIGNRYKIIGSDAATVTVLDQFRKNTAPQSSQIGHVYTSVGNGEAEYIGGLDINTIDELSRFKIVAADNELFWRHFTLADSITLDSANRYTDSKIIGSDSLFSYNQSKWLFSGDTLLIDTSNIEGLLDFVQANVSGGDNWGNQSVVSDNTLTGTGTMLNPLKVDTTLFAMQGDIPNLTLYQQYLDTLTFDATKTFVTNAVAASAHLPVTLSTNGTGAASLVGQALNVPDPTPEIEKRGMYSTLTAGNNVDFNQIEYDRAKLFTTQPIHVLNYTGQTNTPFGSYGQLLTFGSDGGLFPVQMAFETSNATVKFRTAYRPSNPYNWDGVPWAEFFTSNNANLPTVPWKVKTATLNDEAVPLSQMNSAISASSFWSASGNDITNSNSGKVKIITGGVDISNSAVSGDTYASLALNAVNYGYVLRGGLKQGVGGELILSLNQGGTVSDKFWFDTQGWMGIGKRATTNLDVEGQGRFTASEPLILSSPNGTLKFSGFNWGNYIFSGNAAYTASANLSIAGYQGEVMDYIRFATNSLYIDGTVSHADGTAANNGATVGQLSAAIANSNITLSTAGAGAASLTGQSLTIPSKVADSELFDGLNSDWYIPRISSTSPWNGLSSNSAASYQTFDYGTSGSGLYGSLISFGGFDGSYNTQIVGAYSYGGNVLKFRTRNGDIGAWNDWRNVWNDGNSNLATVPWNVSTATVGSHAVPLSQMNSAINTALSGGTVYVGTWNASTNTPTLTDATGTKGHMYAISTTGTRSLGSGSLTWYQGGFAIHNGTIWEYVGSTSPVTSVNGFAGNVLLYPELSGNLLNIRGNTTTIDIANATAVAANTAKTSFPGFTSLSADYSFTDNSTNWNTAYRWGNHAGLYVDLTTAQTVAGQKTFTDNPTIYGTQPTLSLKINSIGGNSSVHFMDMNGYEKGGIYYSFHDQLLDFVSSGDIRFLNGISETMRMDINGKLKLNKYISASSFPVTPVGMLVFDSSGNIGTQTISGGSSVHSALTNLSYATSGHTGFAGTAVANTFTENQTITKSTAQLTLNGTNGFSILKFENNGSFNSGFYAQADGRLDVYANSYLNLFSGLKLYGMPTGYTPSAISGMLYYNTSDNTFRGYNGSTWVNLGQSGGGSGTVTNVGMTVPTGLTVSPSAISTSGTFAVGMQSGYSIPTTANQTNWGYAFNAKVNSLAVTGTTTKTITLTRQDGSTISGSFTDLSGGSITGSGTSGQVSYWDGISSQTGSSGFTTDGTNLAISGNVTSDNNRVQSSVGTSMDSQNGMIGETTTLSANRTITLSNLTSGQEGSIETTQNATGGYTVTLSHIGLTSVKMGNKTNVNTAANSHTTIVYWVTGTKLYYGFIYGN